MWLLNINAETVQTPFMTAARVEPRSTALASDTAPGMLSGLRVIEVADETAEYCGLLLAGLGAEVIKIEPAGGSPTRRIAPFCSEEPDPEKSLYFWAYNRGKKSAVADLDTAGGREMLVQLLGTADILLDASCGMLNEQLGLTREALAARYPSLVIARMTPFGDDGPWSTFKGSDLVHLALGGVMMNCGYDPDPSELYDLPPIAPQIWHAYHIAGEQLMIGILAALIERTTSGLGQDISCAIHEAVAKSTEIDLMSWVMRRAPLHRLTCRHALEAVSRVPNISHTKDGRWYMTWGVGARDKANLVPFLERFDMAADLEAPTADADFNARSVPGSSKMDDATSHTLEVVQRFVRAHTYDATPWQEAQAAGLLWAPVRKPHENAQDEHWLKRGAITKVDHPELGRSFHYATSKWLSSETRWQAGKRAPLRGEHTGEVSNTSRQASPKVAAEATLKPALSARNRPFPLQNVRIFDFSWFLASAGGTRFAAALGAECIKVEWKENPDTRLAAMAPVGGRTAREAATGPLPGVSDPDMGGQFNNKNTGKRGLSLNIRHPKGIDIAKRLIAISDVVAEGFSPGVLDRLGLGYDVLRSIRPDIIYVQQSGMGSYGTYGRLRTVGPIAASFAGMNEMSGLAEPAMPAGWGYSYLDWMGAYGFAQSLLGALYYRSVTGKGQHIDASQCEAGIFLASQAILDWSANGRVWQRTGNRSPYGNAAPHGAYRCQGADRWIAISCCDQRSWAALAHAAGHPEWLTDPRFANIAARLVNQDALDKVVGTWTEGVEAYDCMSRLQAAGVAAGVCQTAEDRCDHDPQLRRLEWLTEVPGTRIGTWPVAEVPFKLGRTPAHAGGLINRGAPCYGEDNEYVLGELLGHSTAQIRSFKHEGVI
ncbi:MULTISPECIES: CaiB/BaiF CoA transferase family protein [Mesorhizobium]|uniref:CoA transferase n=5 Tax=Mesorhizobium TaxID=68287 RepID=A0AB38THJ3_9HYPH|nr:MULTISPECIES: CoA transferase [Mesorhizobium]MDF3212191.1 CoA transferase [Mesorhizobium ciceri]UTU54435.1 CoA transferase [Mesorhizobium ciceri]